VNSLFCRHNRFTADCPICKQGTALDVSRSARSARARPAAGAQAPPRRRAAATPSGPFAGPYVVAGPYERPDGGRYEVRLERVPGGVRLAEWARGQLVRRAPVLVGADLAELVRSASERSLLPERDLRLLADAVGTAPEAEGGSQPHGASPGRAGDMRDELRVEPVTGGMVRVARWSFKPGTGWILSDAPTLFPAGRYAQALAGAARLGLLAGSAPA
jgi:hypothetical protein